MSDTNSFSIGDRVVYRPELKGALSEPPLGVGNVIEVSREGLLIRVNWPAPMGDMNHGPSYLRLWRPEPIQMNSRVRYRGSVEGLRGLEGYVVGVVRDHDAGCPFTVKWDNDRVTYSHNHSDLCLSSSLPPDTGPTGATGPIEPVDFRSTINLTVRESSPAIQMLKHDSDKESRPELIPAPVIYALGVLYARGARKYAAENWRNGAQWSRTLGALQRHLLLWQMGENYDIGIETDAGTGVHHLIAVAWNAITLFMLWATGKGQDDRPDKSFDRRMLAEANPRDKKVDLVNLTLDRDRK